MSRHVPVVVALFDQEFPHTNNCLLPTDQRRPVFPDPNARLGYAYVMNKMDFYLSDDPREKRCATRCIARSRDSSTDPMAAMMAHLTR